MQDKTQELRDQFAMSVKIDPDWVRAQMQANGYKNIDHNAFFDYEAQLRYIHADAMIKYRTAGSTAKSQPAETGEAGNIGDTLSNLELRIKDLYAELEEGSMRKFIIHARLESMLRVIESATDKQTSELPERWCIERTKENAEMVNVWANNKTKGGTQYGDKDGYMHSEPVIS